MFSTAQKLTVAFLGAALASSVALAASADAPASETAPAAAMRQPPTPYQAARQAANNAMAQYHGYLSAQIGAIADPALRDEKKESLDKYYADYVATIGDQGKSAVADASRTQIARMSVGRMDVMAAQLKQSLDTRNGFGFGEAGPEAKFSSQALEKINALELLADTTVAIGQTPVSPQSPGR